MNWTCLYNKTNGLANSICKIALIEILKNVMGLGSSSHLGKCWASFNHTYVHTSWLCEMAVCDTLIYGMEKAI